MMAWQDPHDNRPRSPFFSAKLGTDLNSTIRSGGRTSPESPHVPAKSLLNDQDKELQLRRAPFYPVDWLLGSTIGQCFGLVVVFFILLGLSMLAWVLIAEGTTAYPPEFKPSFWITFWMIFDPGTQTGLWIDPPGEETPAVVLWTACVISSFGFVFMLTLLGLVVESIRQLLSNWIKTRSRIVLSGHILILGWTDKTIYLLRQMIQEADSKGVRKAVVILSMTDEIDMNQMLKDHGITHARRHKVITRKGCPFDLCDLDRVSVCSAKDVIVCASAGPPHEADLEVMRVCLALAALEQEPGRILAEVRCTDLTPVLQGVLPEKVNGIHTRSPVNRMLSLMAAKPLVGDVLAGLSSFGEGEELYCSRVKQLVGLTFADACYFFRGALCVGVKSADRPQAILAPPDDRKIEETDRLIFLASDEVQISGEHSQQELPRSRRSCCCSRFSQSRVASAVNDATGISSRVKNLLIGEDWYDRDSMMEVVPPSLDHVLDQDRSGQLYIILGWPDDFRDVVMSLDKYVRPGTKVHVLSERPMEGPEGRRRVLSSPSWKPKNVEVVHHIGRRTNTDRLVTLPLADANSILVLAEQRAEGSVCGDSDGNVSSSDAATVTSAMMVLFICQGRYGREKQQQQRGRIICEVLDPRTERMIKRNLGLQAGITFFRSNAMETGLFAMAYSEPSIFNLLVLLVSPSHDAGKIVSVAVTNYVQESEFTVDNCSEEDNHAIPLAYLSFWDLHHRVRAGKPTDPPGTGGLLIGWYRVEDGRTRLGASMDRNEHVRFSTRDRLIIIKLETKKPRAILSDDALSTGEYASSGQLKEGVPATIKVSVAAPVGCAEQVLHESTIKVQIPNSMPVHDRVDRLTLPPASPARVPAVSHQPTLKCTESAESEVTQTPPSVSASNSCAGVAAKLRTPLTAASADGAIFSDVVVGAGSGVDKVNAVATPLLGSGNAVSVKTGVSRNAG